MIWLIAEGPNHGERAEAQLIPGGTLLIGRPDARDNEAGRPPKLALPWEGNKVSRQQARATLEGDSLEVKCDDSARNPMQVEDRVVRSATLRSGDIFQIGSTTFLVQSDTEIDDGDESGPEETVAHSFQQDELEAFDFRELQVDLLSRLPEMMDQSRSRGDFAAQLVELMLEGLPRAVATAVVHYDLAATEHQKNSDGHPIPATLEQPPVTMQVATRDTFSGRFTPSRKLMLQTYALQQSTAYVWKDQVFDEDTDVPSFVEGLNWAYCVPILNEASYGWCLYVSGAADQEVDPITKADLGGDIRFTELMAQFVGSVRQLRLLEEQKTKFSSFFSPRVVESLTTAAGESALAPAKQDITVLFCDVRGFSRKSEQFQDDLHGLLACVRRALAAMTDAIIDFEGTIADFQGDAALGFWGWPVALADGPVDACRAALALHARFKAENIPGGSLEGFDIGVGVAHGTAIAGQIGTPRQAKVGVFGPVVNQGARLESMTRQFEVGIIVDEKTADYCCLTKVGSDD